MATPSLRPLGIGEILDAGIKVFTRNWRVLVGCTVGPIAPAAVLFVLLLWSVDPEALEVIPEESNAEPELPAAGLIAGFLLLGIVGLIALILAHAACFKAVFDAWLGGKPAIGDSMRWGLRRLWKLTVLSIVWTGFTIVAIIPCGIPYVWLGIFFCVCAPALLVEDIGPFKAMGRSYRLIQQRWWATFALVLVCYMLTSVVSFVIQIPLIVSVEVVAPENVIAAGLAQMLAYLISFAITTPYFVTVLTVLYFDQRVRKEGFDLQLMANSMGIERDPNAPIPVPHYAAPPYGPPPPGWQPPPAQPPPWSSPTGWAPPSPEQASPPPLWGTGERPPPAESPWMTPSPPDDDDEEKRNGDKDRADWLPPEDPRGPGGL